MERDHSVSKAPKPRGTGGRRLDRARRGMAARTGRRWARFLNRLLPAEQRGLSPLAYHLTLLRLGTLMAVAVTGLLFSTAYALVDLAEGDVIVALTELGIGILILSTPLVGARFGRLDVMMNLVILTFGALFLVAIFDELPEDKSSLAWLAAIPALAFVFKGSRALYFCLGYLPVHAALAAYAGRLTTPPLADAYMSYAFVTAILYLNAAVLEKYGESWKAMAQFDRLTGVRNRNAVEEAFLREAALSRRYGDPLALVVFDLDDFKRINDTHGHVIGDRVLRAVARTVAASLRRSDVLARWGGEEFVILLPHTDLAAATEVAEKVREAVASSSVSGVRPVTASFGVTQYGREEELHDLVARADQALYTAKRLGKNRVCTVPAEPERTVRPEGPGAGGRQAPSPVRGSRGRERPPAARRESGSRAGPGRDPHA